MTVLKDSSGNGNDGIYASGVVFVPGAVAGNDGIEVTVPAVGVEAADAPLSTDPFTGDFTILLWIEFVSGSQDFTGVLAKTGGGGITTIRFDGQGTSGGALHLRRTYDSGFGQVDDWVAYPAPFFPYAAGPHFLAVSYDAATNLPTFYVDGDPYVAEQTGGDPDPHPMMLTTVTMQLAQSVAGAVQDWDEMAFIPSALSDGTIASLYSAASTSFAAWTSSVLAVGPTAFYHLDGPSGGWLVGSVGIGR